MKVKKVASRKKDHENEDSSADSLEMKKKKLKREILELKTMITRVEKQNTDATMFGELASMGLTLPTDNAREIQTSVPNVDSLFANEIYTYLGFHCVKVTRNEYVFNLVGSDSGDETFSLQIWSNDGRVSLGNWVMPMSVNMEKIYEKTPIESLVMVIPFLKNCKHHVDCYRQRKKQFDELKELISDTSNCEIDANLGFTLITLHLLGVHNKPKDSNVDLTINLSYKTNETLPCAISVDWNLRKDPSQQQENEIKSYAKFLKNQRLLKGFSNMTKSSHPVYYWEMEEYVDSPLELNNSSDSGEKESLLIVAKQNQKKLTDRRRKDRQLKDHWRKPQKQTSVVTKFRDMDVSTDEENEDPTIENHSSGDNRTKSTVDTIGLPRFAKEKKTTSKTVGKSRQTTKNSTGKNMRATNARTKNPVGNTEQKYVSTKARTVTSRNKKPVGKTEKRSDSSKSRAVTARKSTLPKSKQIGILTVKKGRKTDAKRIATSTPVRKQSRSKVNFAAISHMTDSPFASADEN